MEHRSLTAWRKQKGRGASLTRGRCSVAWNMSTQTPKPDNCTERPAPSVEDIREKSQIGTDEKGREHYYCQVRRTVYVLDEGAVAHAELVADRPLRHWVAFVHRRVGWDPLIYSPGPLIGGVTYRGP